MKEKVIRVLKVAPFEEPVVCELNNNLSSLQEAVSIDADYVGLIEIISIDSKVCLLLNEEGKLIGLAPNRRYGDDVLCGVFYVCGQNSRSGNLTSLSDKQIEEYTAMFKEVELISREEAWERTLAGFMSFPED